MSSAVQDLLAILDLERLENNLFRGRSPQVGWQRVFGGQVIGQALVAACRTADVQTFRQNGLAIALREVGRIERTLFIMLDWLESPQLRQLCHAGLNKSEQ